MIETRDGEQVREIALSRGEWCSFTSENGVRYVVTKPLSTRRLNPTLELRALFGSKITVRRAR